MYFYSYKNTNFRWFSFFASIVGKNNMSGHWCHWYMLSPSEWENCDNEKGNPWTIQLIKDNLEKQLLDENMVPYDKKDVFTNGI